MRFYPLILFVFLSTVVVGVLAQSPVCGREADGAVCPNDECCGSQGLCGSTEDFCSTQNGCQSNCHLLPSNISDLINRTTFENMFSHRNDSSCEGSFYTYNAFMAATSVFGGFGRIGNSITQKREIAAFLAQTAYATAGNASDPYYWGYCHVVEQNTTKEDYCIEGSINWPCAEGKQYYGRGPIQLRFNTYYGPVGLDLGYPLPSDPDLFEKDPVMSFKSALHYWMNYHLQKPSCHAVMTNQWVANSDDVEANRVAGFGLTTNIIDGEVECGHGEIDSRDRTRFGFYLTFCDLLGVPIEAKTRATDTLDCSNQQPYGPAPVTKIFTE